MDSLHVALATDSPTGVLDHLKRRLDRVLKPLFQGEVLPYWFAIDVEGGRLHIHGGFAAHPNLHASIRQAIKDAWGEWEGRGKRKQVRFRLLYSDGWADYCMRHKSAVAKIIGPRTYTMNHPMRRDAEQVYSIVRQIMRAAT